MWPTEAGVTNVEQWDREFLWHFRAKSLRIIDGDSLVDLLDLGCYARYEARIRLADVWAAETYEPGGTEATRRLMTAIETGYGEWPLRVVTRQRDTIVSEVQSFNRYVSDVFVVQSDGTMVPVKELLQ